MKAVLLTLACLFPTLLFAKETIRTKRICQQLVDENYLIAFADETASTAEILIARRIPEKNEMVLVFRKSVFHRDFGGSTVYTNEDDDVVLVLHRDRKTKKEKVQGYFKSGGAIRMSAYDVACRRGGSLTIDRDASEE